MCQYSSEIKIRIDSLQHGLRRCAEDETGEKEKEEVEEVEEEEEEKLSVECERSGFDHNLPDDSWECCRKHANRKFLLLLMKSQLLL